MKIKLRNTSSFLWLYSAQGAELVKIMQPLGAKNVLKMLILVTNKIQEIGIYHLGLVFQDMTVIVLF